MQFCVCSIRQVMDSRVVAVDVQVLDGQRINELERQLSS